MLRITFLINCVFAVVAIHAASAEDARVLPKGRSRFGFIYGQSGGITQRLNAEGKTESITAPYNMSLDSANLQKLSPKIKELVRFLDNSGNLRYNHSQRNTTFKGVTPSADPSLPKLSEALSIGDLNVAAEAQRTQYVLSYQYGVSDNLSMGIMVPIVKTKVKVKYGITGDNTARDIYDFFAPTGMNPKHAAGLQELANATTETFQSAIQDLGYERFQDSERSGLGDLAIGGRYKYLDSVAPGGAYLHSMQMSVTVPTGALKKPSQITALDLGDGSWDIGLAHIMNYRPSVLKSLRLSNSLNYSYRLPGHREMRVRKNPDDFLPDASTEENLSQRLGDKFWINLGAKYYLSKVFSLDTSYEWYWKRADKFQGTRGDRDYTYLSDGTNGTLQTVQVGASIDVVQAFLDHQFPVPGEFALNFYMPTGGRNRILAPYGTAELALYF